MIAYSRGSQTLAGAASMKQPHAGVTRAFCNQLNIAQWVEQQTRNRSVAGSTPAIQPLFDKTVN
jgi:hypothetical protein